MILLRSPLKNDPPKTMVSIFFLEIEIVDNQNSQLKKFEKNLSSASVDDERPQVSTTIKLVGKRFKSNLISYFDLWSLHVSLS